MRSERYSLTKVYNFNPGPAILPRPVLEKAQAELLDYQGTGMSILEMSHRSREYEAINAQAEERIKSILDLGEDYRVLFIQGGASTQFAMVPLNFLSQEQTADYVLTGTWSEKARDEAMKVGNVHTAGSTQAERYCRIPSATELELSSAPAYVHITSNNTLWGTQWHTFPDVGDRRLVADMSSDILSRPFDASKFSLIYAGAQKNMGAAGVTVVITRTDWLTEVPKSLPTMLRYTTYAKNNSLYNTPPVFAVYLLNLVLEWIQASGGLEALGERNQRKAEIIYEVLDASNGYYQGHAAPDSRSWMNMVFRLPSEKLDREFIQRATDAGFVGLAGHRSVGGVRVSLYNAMGPEGCEALAQFMREFANKH